MVKDESAGIILKKQLARWLEEKSLTAAELSRQAAVPKQTISDWLGGVAPRNLPALLRIAKVLKTTIESLVFGEASSSSQPLAKELQTIFGQELVIITEHDLIRHISEALVHVLGEKDLSFQGRPIYEFIHIDDIRSMLDWYKISPHCFRLVGLHGETRMTLHRAMPLGSSGIAVHHLARMSADGTSLLASKDFFDVRELLDTMARIFWRKRDSRVANCKVTYGTQPVYVCSVRSLLGRLLLSIVHDLAKPIASGAGAASTEEIVVLLEGDGRDFRIRLQGLLHDPGPMSRSYDHVVEACGVNLRFWTSGASRIVVIQGPRIFLTPELARDVAQVQKIK